MKPEKIVKEVKESGLRGRGGAGFPTGVKWSFVPKNIGKPIYLLNNADESEPGTFKDRLLMERDPHLCIEGMMIAAFALDCHWSCLYIRGEYGYPAQRMDDAITEAYKKGYLGKGIFGSNFDLDIIVHRGAGAYICGEETGLIESLEGNKGQPRIKPPFPAIKDFFPFLYAFANPSAIFTVFSIFSSFSTKAFTVSYDVKYEFLIFSFNITSPHSKFYLLIFLSKNNSRFIL